MLGAATVTSGCSTSTPAALPVSLVQPQTQARRPAWYRPAPFQINNVVYVASYYNQTPVYGYDYWKTHDNLPPVCSVPGDYVVDVATDPGGDLIVPEGGTRTVRVYRGPGACGAKLGAFPDKDGQPSDAASWNAKTGTIYVANILAAGQKYGDVSVCSLESGCTAVLKHGAIGGQLFGVAADKAGNVYATGRATASGTGAVFIVWKNGGGKAIRISAYRNTSPGGLEIDPAGNILALDAFAPALWIYTGCPDSCAAHGPFALKGQSVYGRVNASGTAFEVADFEYGQIDVYKYAGTKGITYLYSYGAGSGGADLEGIAIDPGAD